MLDRVHDQTKRLKDIFDGADGARQKDIQAISTGDPFAEFYKRLNSAKEFHRKYPNEPVDNLEKSYRRQGPADDPMGVSIDTMFNSEESYGRFFDLMSFHNEYINLPVFLGSGHRRPNYLQYLDTFDVFVPPQCPLQRKDKLNDGYFKYVTELASYLEAFMRKTKPLEDLPKLFNAFDREFEEAWEKQEVEGWKEQQGSQTSPEGHSIWCVVCQKEFTNPNTYEHHIGSKKHIKNAAAREAQANGDGGAKGNADLIADSIKLKEKAIAEREYRIQKLANAMQSQRSDTKHNVERKQGMTETERQEELETMRSRDMNDEEDALVQPGEEGSDNEEDKIYNPLRLPLAWDGKPIPYWLYKLHGLGNEFHCEICGNFTYMGRRAWEKHFNETRHIYGLKCLGVVNTGLFRDITTIAEATRLNDQILAKQKKEQELEDNVVEMEDGYGNVMPEKVYIDLQKQGLL